MSIFFCINFASVQPVMLIADPIDSLPLGGRNYPCV